MLVARHPGTAHLTMPLRLRFGAQPRLALGTNAKVLVALLWVYNSDTEMTTSMIRKSEFILALVLILLGVSMRFLPHPANFAPIAAVALFSGMYLRKWYAFVVPLAAMVISDWQIGFHNLIAYTWGSFVLVGVIGWYVRRHKNPTTIVLGTVSGSALFYLVTNFGVWLQTDMYAKTWQGLLECYTLALPFFRNTILGDLFYTGALVGCLKGLRTHYGA